MQMSENVADLATALAKAQGEMENAAKNAKNPHFKSMYADLAEIVNVSRPVLAKHGLSLVQSPGYADGAATVTTLLLHRSGQWLMDVLTSPVGKQDAQGIGSAITYLRRYSRAAFCGLAQEDDDGNAASAPAKPRKVPMEVQMKIQECMDAVAEAENKEQLRSLWDIAHKEGYLEHVAEHIKARKAQVEAL